MKYSVMIQMSWVRTPDRLNLEVSIVFLSKSDFNKKNKNIKSKLLTICSSIWNRRDGYVLTLLGVFILDVCIQSISNIIQIYSGITSGRVLDGDILYTEIPEANLFVFVYRLFQQDFSLERFLA